MVGAILRSSRWNALSVKRESRKRLATSTPGGFLPDDGFAALRCLAVVVICSKNASATPFPFAIHSTTNTRHPCPNVPAIHRRHPVPLNSTAPKRARGRRSKPQHIPARLLALLLLSAAGIGVATVVLQYTFTLQSPFRIRFQWPLVIAPRISGAEAGAA